MFRSLAFFLTCWTTAAVAGPPDFGRDIAPLLQRHCIECHGPKAQEGDLRFDDRGAFLAGGSSGKVLIAGQPDESEILRRVLLPADDPEHMPSNGSALTADEIAALQDWIVAGAAWPADYAFDTHWAYVAPKRPNPPDLKNAAWSRGPIDRFILARLDDEGLAPSPEATKTTLLRRVTLDLTGLPPTPAELDSFLSDDSPDAYEKIVDHLMASPAFGEKWARSWLDLARYADSHGFQRDDLRSIWPYRDWVIRALNQSMPFDQFTIEQLAGDLLPDATEDQRIATGFHRCTTTNVEAGSEPEETRVNQILDRVNTTATVWLGSTLECAQCHDHKYDPFTQQDYYRLFAYFNGTEIEAERTKPNVPGSIAFRGPMLTLAGGSEIVEQREELEATLASLNERIASLGGSADGAATGEAKTTPLVKRRDRLAKRLETISPPSTLVMIEQEQHRETRLFRRGVYTDPGDVVTPAPPAILADGDVPPTRLGLAQWLVSRENPLTARVVVNRWWAELFGHGLVSTAEDFGVKGAPPTHPELLDSLAVEFMESGWDMKHVVRTIVTSATYRQASRITPDLLERDPENVLYARGPRFRLDAETIRDQALAVAGLLSDKQYGSPVRPYQPEGLWAKVGGDAAGKQYVVSPGEDAHRRGVYVVWKRSAAYPSFTAFDATSRLTCTIARSRSNTPLQALVLLNDPVYVEAALAFAKRIVTERPEASLDDRLRHAVRRCLSREPNEDEFAILRSIYQEQYESASSEPERAKTLLAKTPHSEGVTGNEMAAWYAVATTLLNLDEVVTKE
ncbi:MAG: PSD1 and planctomycete cytochrome C domain-containing protein [Planctomycetota bacterium]|nr:DUF1553 domain-containing protein [Planctomycetaceae bacterium]MDQ3332082.1 PSD1 and planctomycete cytochrome C domain-containing protein [Planctomycetota bacterium]